MLYELLYPLHRIGWLRWLNVLRYVPFRVIAATLTAMLISFFISPWFIRELQKKQIGQIIRGDGPESHLKKSGTPTMGGALILLSVLVPTILWCDAHNVFVWATTAVTAGYGVIGYLDDYLKIKAKTSAGLPGRYKLLGQFLIGGGVLAYTFYAGEDKLPKDWFDIRGDLAFPFVAFYKHHYSMNLAVYLVFATLVVVATSNAVNLTDGLDGLAIGPVIINASTYLLWAYLAGATFGISVTQRFVVARYLDIPNIASVTELSIFCGAMVGAGIGFLWYNTYPAQVFMGDVGALALGGGLGMCAVFTKNELLSIILGGVFFLEMSSVIVQVISFKLFKKRVFLMAPIHHHYEKKGWPEPKIIVRFWIISVLLALIAISSLKLR